jgi:hypothetical protein
LPWDTVKRSINNKLVKDRSVEDYQLLIDLHKRANRQGPGGDAESEKALNLAMIDRGEPLKVADIGCGTGGFDIIARSSIGSSDYGGGLPSRFS